MLKKTEDSKKKKALMKRPASDGAETTKPELKADDGPVPKVAKPAAAKASKHTKLEVKAKPAVKRRMSCKDEIVEVPKSKILKAMPKVNASKTNASPIHYWGGVIYTAMQAKRFRALKVRGDVYTEKQSSWGKTKTPSAAWNECVKAIEDHHKKPKKK